MVMKRILFFVVLLCVVTAQYSYSQDKQKKSEIIASAVANKMLQKNLVMVMTGIISDYGRLALDGSTVRLIDNKFTCDLPYRGSSRINTYGSQDGNIKATNVEVDVKSEYNEKKKFYRLNFTFAGDNDNELYDVSLKVFTNGKVIMNIGSTKRSAVDYQGGLYIEY